MADDAPRPQETQSPAPAAQDRSSRATVALELSKIVIPVVGTILTACLSGMFLLLNNPNALSMLRPAAQPTPTPQPTATEVLPTGTAITWTLLFEDDFSNPASGWPTVDDDTVEKIYSDGGYLVTMRKDNISTFTRSEFAEILTDVRVEVDALQIGDQSPWDIGVSCRLDGQSVYDMSIYESNGVRKYGIYRWENGAYETLAEKVVEDPRSLREGRIANQLRGECVGNHIAMWVNGVLVLEASDPNPLPRGKSGIVTGYSAGVQVFYDNFAVYTP